MRAVLLGRRGHGVELATNYWIDACHYAEESERKADTPNLFSFLESNEAWGDDAQEKEEACV